jgi:hypothetical protein
MNLEPGDGFPVANLYLREINSGRYSPAGQRKYMRPCRKNAIMNFGEGHPVHTHQGNPDRRRVWICNTDNGALDAHVTSSCRSMHLLDRNDCRGAYQRHPVQRRVVRRVADGDGCATGDGRCRSVSQSAAVTRVEPLNGKSSGDPGQFSGRWHSIHRVF